MSAHDEPSLVGPATGAEASRSRPLIAAAALSRHAFSTVRLDGQEALGMQLLLLLGLERDLTLAQCAAKLKATPPNVSSVVNRLAAQKLVSKTEDPRDSRRRRISRTGEGSRVVVEYLERLDAA